MKEDLADTIVYIALCLLILIVAVIVLGVGHTMGEDNIIQKIMPQ